MYVDCPVCNQGIAEPFTVDSSPFPFVHGHGGSRCRIIIWPLPRRYGVESKSYPIPRNQSLENAVIVAKRAWRAGGWAMHRYQRPTLQLATAA